MGKIFEVVSYELNDNVSEADAIAANEKSFDFVKSQAGFIKRSVVCEPDGQWMDIVEWDDKQSAIAASEKFMADERNHDLLGIINQKSLKMQHLETKLAS